MATEKDHRQLQLDVVRQEAAMSSRSSRRPKNIPLASSEQLSSARHELTQSVSGLTLSEEKVDPATPTEQLDVVPPQSTRSKASLMKKLSLLLYPGKKSKSKPGGSAKKPLLPLTHAAGGAGKELELLFAQAEATLGELLVRAGASFDARSSSSHHADHPSHARGRSNSDGQATLLGSASGRSAGLSTAGIPGHARRKSLSRVWQQLGGSFFSCGSGHMNGTYVREEMPLPAHTSTSFSSGVYEDVVLDEAYWQSLADAMLMQRHQHAKLADHGAKLAADSTLHHHSQIIREVQVEGCNVDLGSKSSAHHDFSFETGSTQQLQPRPHSGGCNEPLHVLYSDEGADGESEIVPSIDPGSICKWTVSGSSTGRSCSLDMDSMTYYKDFTGVEGRAGSTRLNTTLDDSPNLAHNYQLLMKTDSTAVMSNSTSVVELLNYYSVPTPAADHADSRRISSQMEASPVSMQPLERFLWQARGAGGGPSSEQALSASSPSSRSAPEFTNSCQEPPAVELPGTATINCRVSLMTLLHEEAAAMDSPTTASSAVEARQEEDD